MPEKKELGGGAARGTARRRSRLSAKSDGGRVSRPLLLAMIVILAGGAYLFWPRGSDAPAGIGEQLTVVTADSGLTAAPRSGSVDIQDQQLAIVPEKLTDGGTTEPARKPEPVVSEKQAPEQQTAAPSTAPPERVSQAGAASTPPPAVMEKLRITPRPSGAWAVQIGAYQTEANAEKRVAAIAGDNVTAHVRAAGTSSGAIVYRVWIAWFASRKDALEYGKQEHKIIGESYPVHR